MALDERAKGSTAQAGALSKPPAPSLRFWELAIQALGMGSGLALVTATLMPSLSFAPELPWQAGQIAASNIKSDEEFTVVDEAATAERRAVAADGVPPIFQDNVEDVEKGLEAIHALFGEMRERLWFSPALYQSAADARELSVDYLELLLASEPPPISPTPPPTPEAIEWIGPDAKPTFVPLVAGAAAPLQDEAGFLDRELIRIVDRYGLKISREDFAQLARMRFAPAIEEAIVQQVGSLQRDRGIILSTESIRDLSATGFIRRNPKTGKETPVQRMEQLLSLSQASELLATKFQELFPGDPALRRTIGAMASLILRPNLTFDEKETTDRKKAAANAIEQVGYPVRKNEMIVREGDPVTPAQLLKLKQLRELKGGENFIYRFLGIGALLALVFELTYRLYIRHYKPSLAGDRHSFILLGSIFILVIVTSRLLLILMAGVAANSSGHPWNNLASYYYVLPFTTGPMLVALMADAHLSVGYAMLFAIPAGLMLGGNIYMAVYTFLGSLAGIYGLSNWRQRAGIWKAGLLVSLTNMAVVLPVALAHGTIFSSSTLLELFCALLEGLLCAILISGLVPVFEYVFTLTTDFKLLELANLDHPLLRQMILQAPGTYQHSFIVGNLAEAAAKSVGANSLLCKVGSYYHDIGKMKNPSFFVENQMGARNKHDKIQPSLSALIITSHVREGVDMAKRYKLGQAIIDIIHQHHGTTLVAFFYNKAKAMEDAKLSEVHEGDYRYDGPKPQTREAAIVMIADSCEAASRTLKNPTYQKVRDMVRKIVQAKVADGQFDDCDLTFRDLHQIERAIEKVLLAQHHTRIDYPGFVFDSRSSMTDTQKVRPLRNEKHS